MKKMFSSTEKLEVNQISTILGKIKTGLIIKRLTPVDLFKEYNIETNKIN